MVKGLSKPLTPEDRHATQCQGKEKFASARLARKIARRQSKKYGRPFNAYRCKECGQWHTGGERGPDSHKRFDPMTPEEDQEWKWLYKRNMRL